MKSNLINVKNQMNQVIRNLNDFGLNELSQEQLMQISGGGPEDNITDPIGDFKRKLV
jgi:bacteriocin-like protein